MGIIKPNLFIIGAPKCGTTSLAYYLSQHPDILFSRPKEPGYFSAFDITKKACSIKNDEDYLNCFSHGGGRYYQIIAEGSTTYMYSSTAIQRIEKFSIDAKYIIMLRPPVDLVISQYFQQLKMGYENQTCFKKAWDLQWERMEGYHIPFSCLIPFNLYYGEIGKLAKYIIKILDIVDRNRVKFILLNNLIKDVKRVYSDVLNFLDLPVPDLDKISFKTLNERSMPKSIKLANLIALAATARSKIGLSHFGGVGNYVRELNKTVAMQKNIDEQFLEKLNSFFENDIKKLSSVTGIKIE